MSKHALTFVVAFIIAVSLVLYMFAFTVRSSEVAVVLQFGRALDKNISAGPHMKWPWPIQDVRKFDSRMCASEGKFEETLTKDRFNVIASLFVGWKIDDVRQFNKNFGRSEKYTQDAWYKLEPLVRNSALAVISRHNLNELVSNTIEPKYADIEEEIKLGAAEAKDYGIRIEMVKLKRLELPQSVTAQVYERMKADRSREAVAFKAEGDRIAAEIRNEAETARQTILTKAAREAETIRAEGDAEAAEQYKKYAKYADLAIYLRKIRALRETTKTKSTFILDPTVPPFDILVQSPSDVKIPLLPGTSGK